MPGGHAVHLRLASDQRARGDHRCAAGRVVATGKGSGTEMPERGQNTFDYGELWSAVVLVTLIAMVLYSVVSALESVVLARYAPDTIGKKK